MGDDMIHNHYREQSSSLSVACTSSKVSPVCGMTPNSSELVPN
jgi:hypothetical protein